MKCGLLGRRLAHSYSPQIHSHFGSYTYDLFPREPEEVETFVKNGDFQGLNVTIPYKKTVLPFCAVLSDTARELGSVNTLVRLGDGKLVGHNTDYFGFLSLVERMGLSLGNKKALVLGSGGASVTAVAVLRRLGARVTVISRSGPDHYQNLFRHKDTALIVNTTPLGMYPQVDAAPLSLAEFPDLEGVIDLIYNPARTRLLLEAEALGIPAENGLWMLVAQAWESAQWFTGHTLPRELMEAVYRILRNSMENIVLVGMPGSGKSTLAALLSRALDRPWVDADREIEKEGAMDIPEIFRTQGEAAFRDLESRVLARLGKESGLIIATGGGCVTREENYAHLRCNGRILWLQRPLEELATRGRPLSRSGSLEAMYRAREPLYRRFSQHSVLNAGTPEETLTQLLEVLS